MNLKIFMKRILFLKKVYIAKAILRRQELNFGQKIPIPFKNCRE